jgi:hypothetical protein
MKKMNMGRKFRAQKRTFRAKTTLVKKYGRCVTKASVRKYMSGKKSIVIVFEFADR